MTKLLIAIASIFVASAVQARDVTLEWDPNKETDLSHYTLYSATRDGDHTGPWSRVKRIEAPTTTVTVTIPDQGNWAWYVTASDKSGNESKPSNMVELYDRTAPGDPVNLHKGEI